MKFSPSRMASPEARFRALKNLGLLMLGVALVLLYAAALSGLPLSMSPEDGVRILSRLELLVFLLLGYCFGRLPSRQNELALKEELGRCAQKTDAAQHAKEQAQQAREALEEKIKNARAALAASPAASDRTLLRAPQAGTVESRQVVLIALDILNS
ncbi:MAG: hypothetical protein SF339_06675 [Blastocatellia bacterium]|nr:hypothetical protein [Blastocatellia bacterium]